MEDVEEEEEREIKCREREGGGGGGIERGEKEGKEDEEEESLRGEEECGPEARNPDESGLEQRVELQPEQRVELRPEEHVRNGRALKERVLGTSAKRSYAKESVFQEGHARGYLLRACAHGHAQTLALVLIRASPSP